MTLTDKIEIENLRESKRGLEKDLLFLIKYFEEDTGLKVKDINLTIDYKLNGQQKVINVKVTAEV